jgi:peptidoglycan L-alanyl-D-glutamate endopeptidase CwlK
MFDEKVSLPRLNTLHPKLRNEAINIFNEIEAKGVKVRCTYALRTFAEQQALYNHGRVTPGNIVTNASAGYSFHNYGLSLDYVLIHDDRQIRWSMTEDLDKDKIPDWLEVANAFKKYGWTWGGDWTQFKDYPHVEKTFGLNINTALNLYNSKKVDSQGYIIF